MIATLLLTSALAARPAIDAVEFVHDFKTARTESVKISANAAMDNNDISLDAEVSLALEPGDEGGAKMAATPKSFMADLGGGRNDMLNMVSDFSGKVDKFGLYDSMTFEGPQSVVMLAYLTQYLPSKSMAEGEEAKFEWSSNGISFKGTIKYEGQEEIEGEKLCKLSYRATLTPGQESPGEMSFVSWFDPMAKRMKGSKGTINISGGDVEFQITRK